MLKSIIKKVIYRHKYDSKSYAAWLSAKGCKIGNNVNFYAPNDIFIDTTRPYFIEIGNNVQITKGVSILTHGYDWIVLKEKYGDVLGSAGPVIIGDNCFIGMCTTILKNVHIGNNVIVGANSLVNKNLESGNVYAGNPARKICCIEEYYSKRKKVQVEEAYLQYKFYRRNMNKEPNPDDFREFFFLFADIDVIKKNETFHQVLLLGENYDKSIEIIESNNREFADWQEFHKYCSGRFEREQFEC